MLSGLTSPWTNPTACAAHSPRPASRHAASTRARSRPRQRARLEPSTSSIAMNSWSPIDPASYTATTLGCRSFAIARASSRTCTRHAPCRRAGSTSLIAMKRSSSGSRARRNANARIASATPTKTIASEPIERERHRTGHLWNRSQREERWLRRSRSARTNRRGLEPAETANDDHDVRSARDDSRCTVALIRRPVVRRHDANIALANTSATIEGSDLGERRVEWIPGTHAVRDVHSRCAQP